jgi:hypothetical protein
MLAGAAVREGDSELAPGGRGSRHRGETVDAGAEAPAAAWGRGGEEGSRRAAVRVEQKLHGRPEEADVPGAGELGQFGIGLARAAVGQEALEGREVQAQFRQLAGHVGKDLLQEAALGEDNDEALIAAFEEDVDEVEECCTVGAPTFSLRSTAPVRLAQASRSSLTKST